VVVTCLPLLQAHVVLGANVLFVNARPSSQAAGRCAAGGRAAAGCGAGGLVAPAAAAEARLLALLAPCVGTVL